MGFFSSSSKKTTYADTTTQQASIRTFGGTSVAQQMSRLTAGGALTITGPSQYSITKEAPSFATQAGSPGAEQTTKEKPGILGGLDWKGWALIAGLIFLVVWWSKRTA